MTLAEKGKLVPGRAIEADTRQNEDIWLKVNSNEGSPEPYGRKGIFGIFKVESYINETKVDVLQLELTYCMGSVWNGK